MAATVCVAAIYFFGGLMSEQNATQFAKEILRTRYMHHTDGNWEGTVRRVVDAVVGGLVDTDTANDIKNAMYNLNFLPGGRFLKNAGLSNVYSNCMVFGAPPDVIDSIDGWGRDVHALLIALKAGVGVGLKGSDIRPKGAPVGNGGEEIAGGPMSYFDLIHSSAEALRKERRAALMFSLSVDHPDIEEFIRAKALTPEQLEQRNRDYGFKVPFNMANLSVTVNKGFFNRISSFSDDDYAWGLWKNIIAHAIRYGEPGIIVERYPGDDLTNVCSEYRTSTDKGSCILGSVNLSAMDNPDHIRKTSRLATIFLMCGMIRSADPFHRSDGTQLFNSVKDDIGLGMMGLHSYLIKRGLPYRVDYKVFPDIMNAWFEGCEDGVRDAYPITNKKPIHSKAIAPNGTISYLTHLGGVKTAATAGIEPMIATAYERRWYSTSGNAGEFNTELVIDPLVASLSYDQQLKVEDTYTIGVQERFDVLTYVQQFMGTGDDTNRQGGISTTINLPSAANEDERKELIDKVSMLAFKYLPDTSGVAFYEEGSRGLSPIKRVSLVDGTIQANGSQRIEDLEAGCRSGVCGA